MTVTLSGRLQTRLVLLSTVGLLWTFAISALLPRPAELGVRMAFQVTLASSIVMTLFSFVWELVYHAVQQLRWEKDWPPLLGLLAGLVEAPLVWLVVREVAGIPESCRGLFIMHFASTWILVWLVMLGPLAIVQPRWRFEGGSFGRRPGDALTPFVVLNGGMAIAVVILWYVWR
jgi:hypothetical protein